MTKNPLLNAFAAVLYIAVIATFMFFGPELIGHTDTVLIPITMLSLFTLSAAVMAYTFFLHPVLMYLDGQKAEAVKLGMQTVIAFAALTALLLTALFTSSLFL